MTRDHAGWCFRCAVSRAFGNTRRWGRACPGGRGFWSPVRIPFPGHLAPARPSTAAGNNAVVSAGRASTRRPFDCHEVARKPQIARAAPHACPAPRATRAVSVAGFRARRGAESALPPPRASRLALRRAPQSARGPLGTARPPERRPSDGERPSEGVLASPPEPQSLRALSFPTLLTATSFLLGMALPARSPASSLPPTKLPSY